MSLAIGVAGKGGTGKTTFAALIIQYLLKENKVPILAVDADPNSNLNMILGIDTPLTIGDVLEEARGMRDLPSGMNKGSYLEYRIQECLRETPGLDLLVMGRPEGPECYCFVNSLLRTYLDRLGRPYRYIIMDNEAGMEHLSRKTTRNLDFLFIMSDPTIIGIRSARKIRDLAQKLDLAIKKFYLVVNRIRNGLSREVEQEIDDKELGLAGVIPEDERVLKLQLEGNSLLSLSGDSPLVRVVEEICAKVGI